MRWVGRAWIVVILAIAAVLAVVVHERRQTGAAPGSIISVPARRDDLESTILASGVIEPRELVSVGAQVSGRLLNLTVGLGDHVTAGQLIGEIDSVPQRNVVRKSQAALLALEAQRDRALALLKQAQLAFRRQTDILAGRAGTRQDYETAEATFASTKADLANLAAQIEGATVDVDIARTDLAYTKITAPIDGTVVAVMTKQGQTVISAQIAPTIVKLADLRTMTVKARISEADVTRLQPGKAVHFTILSQPDRTFETTLRTIEPAPDQIQSDSAGGAAAGGGQTGGADNSAIYYNGRFEIDNADGVLRPFMTAQIAFVLDAAKHAIVVPLAALRNARGHAARVQVLDARGHIGDRAVRTGIDNGVDVQITNGLEEGETVVIAGPDDVPKETTTQ